MPAFEHIPLFQPAYSGKEEDYLREAFQKWRQSSAGSGFRSRCEKLLVDNFKYSNFHLISNFRIAAEIVLHPLIITPGAEVILSGYAPPVFTEIILAAKAIPRYADINPQTLNAEPEKISALINENTVAIVITHYAGVAARMPEIKSLATKKKILLIEDCSMALGSSYDDNFVGSYGDIALFSFEETDCITAGSGAGITTNNKALSKQLEKYLSNHPNVLLPAANSAILCAQLETRDKILQRRKQISGKYYNELLYLEHRLLIRLPSYSDESAGNGQLFYLLCNSEGERDALIKVLKNKNIHTAAHYTLTAGAEELPASREASRKVLLLPVYYELSRQEHQFIIQSIIDFYTTIQ